MKIGLVVGDISGDNLGAFLLKNVFNKYKKINISGIIGPKLKKIGCVEIIPLNDLSTFGLIEPILKIRKIINIKQHILKYFVNTIDLFIGIDFSGFNLNIESNLKHFGIFTIHIVSPSIWAWRYHRINKIKSSTNIIMVLFPFEENIYLKFKIPVIFLGHPFSDNVKTNLDKTKIKDKLNFTKDNVIISLLPGSRTSEIKVNIPVYISLIKKLTKEKSNVTFIIPVANIEHQKIVNSILLKKNDKISVHLIVDNFYKCLKLSDLIITASGTASLEAILHEVETIVVYKIDKISFILLKNLVKINYISLPNILLNEKIIPELIQHNFNVEKIYIEIKNKFTKNRSIEITKTLYNFRQIKLFLNNNSQAKINNFISNFIIN